MFKRNEKIVRKLNETLETECQYNKETKHFELLTINLNGQTINKIKKLGLEFVSIQNIDESFKVILKVKSDGQKWIIRSLSFTIIAIAIQFLYIASKIVFYVK